ncbi:DUF1501 domain-containing protein [Erythrobacter crassostreae]|uniref:DUF1501 domain-containing protein n=1 Tax=Erythrobacter crassostreae TaxID=2828328 RepID=A0A9X1JP28_9SPHN|nr:DUF1501 domain-containing protein [Erythrobacter crassostrea]MBV7258997.1 DUF1501 domain-containing protein [Erythrobacter crassostrea]
MYIGKSDDLSRRAFIKRSTQLASAGATSSFGLGLAGVAESAAFGATDGYKALVCVFLSGGNDHANTLIPYDPVNHAKYFAIRGHPDPSTGQVVGFNRDQLLPTALVQDANQILTDDIHYALSPWMPRLKTHFDDGRLAPVLNVGTLEAPLTKAQYESGDKTKFPRPQFLFSHNDQSSIWQSSQPEGARSGWGGRMSDLAQGANQNSMFTCINVAGTSVFLNGETAVPYRITPSGPGLISGLRRNVQGSSTASRALDELIRSTDPNILKADYADINRRSIEYGAFINDALARSTISTDFGSSNDLADQLAIVARLIASRNSLGVSRQVFYVTIKGFDSHSNLNAHQRLLGEVDYALDAFYSATLEMGISDQVTLFTASDFGRTLSINGTGSDHGWGGHHFVLGGAVRGHRFYGTAPSVSLNSEDQVGRGRLLPNTSVDEYSATLAKWFGVSETEMSSVQPNIGRFASPDLGFMKNSDAF